MRDIVFYNNPILHKKAEPVRNVNGAVCQLVDEMADVMKKAAGIGIAAPQVGESLQLAIVDIPKEMGGIGKVVLINPRIISAYGSEIGEEGCLSIPGIQVKVKRYKEVNVETMNLENKVVTYKGTGLLARAIQHEIDHLNGILIIDKAGPIKRLLVKRKFRSVSEVQPHSKWEDM